MAERTVPFSADIDLQGFIPPLPPGPPPPNAARASPVPPPLPPALPPPPPPPAGSQEEEEEEEEDAHAPPPPPPDSPLPPPEVDEGEQRTTARSPSSSSSAVSVSAPQLPPISESSHPPSPLPSPSSQSSASGRPSPSPAPSALLHTPLSVRASPVVGTTPPPPPHGGHSPNPNPSPQPSPQPNTQANPQPNPNPLPNGSGAPAAARRPVAITPVASSGTYQSLSASFGDAPEPNRAPPSSASTSQSTTTGRSRGEVASPAKASGSAGSGATVQPTGRSRADSIDRLTGRVPLPPSPTAPVLKVGWLKKEGDGLLGGFKKRWCVLSPRTLDILKEPTDDRDKSLGCVVLPGASVFALPDEGDRCEFHILPVTGKKVAFRAESESERNAWVSLLHELCAVPDDLLAAVFDSDSYSEWSRDDLHSTLLPALTRLLSKVGTMSSVWGAGDRGGVGVLLSGYITKMGEKVRNYKRRYFVLVGSVLMYFESEESYALTDTGGHCGPAAADGEADGQVQQQRQRQQHTPGMGSAATAAASAAAVVGPGAPAAPASSVPCSKSAHGKEVFASLARTHMRAQRRSITPIDLQNHHLIRRGSAMPGGAAAATGGGASGGSGANTGAAATAAGGGSSAPAASSAAHIKKAMKGEGRPALGLIPLRDCTLTLESSSARPWGFALQTKDRKYMLHADNEEELRAWVYVLNLVVLALPIRGYMKKVLEDEMDAAAAAATAAGSRIGVDVNGGGSGVGNAHPALVPAMLSDTNLALLKKHLSTTLLDPTAHRYLRNYWAERQSFHESRTYPTLFPLQSPLALVDERGRSFFDGLLTDEAGAHGEHALPLPLHYLSFWMDAENWMSLRTPTRAGGEGGGEDSNEWATPQDPSFVRSGIPLPMSYRQARAEEIIDKYLSHGAPFPVVLPAELRDEIMASSLRGTSAPNKIAPAPALFQRAQEAVTEMIALEVLPRYLRSRGSNWSYLRALQARYDEALLQNRAALLAPDLLARGYEPDVYEELSTEEKDAEEDDRLARFSNLVSRPSDELDALVLECAEQFGKLPNADATKLLYHNYLYALQRLREYHSLFAADAAAEHAALHAHQPQLSLPYRQMQAAKAFYHDFLSSGSPWALCVPYKLVRNLRGRLLFVGDNPRAQFLFMDVECVLLTELQFGMEEAAAKVKQQVASQRMPLKKASVVTGMMGGVGMAPPALPLAAAAAAAKAKAPAPTYNKRRSIIALPNLAGQPPPPPPSASAASAAAAAAGAGAAIPPLPSSASASAGVGTLSLSETEVPFNMVLGVPVLFSYFRRFSLTCRHANPHLLWDQLALVARVMDYRCLSDPRVMQLYAREVYVQYCADAAPHKVPLSRGVIDQLKVSVSQASPGPHCFLGVLRELFRTLESLYSAAFKNGGSGADASSASALLYSCMQEEFGLWVREEICVTQGRRDPGADAYASAGLLLSNNKNAATWFDVLDPALKDVDESLVNLSAHQSMWCAYFKQFLVERFCSENAIFYAEADDYRRAPGPSYRMLKAKRLYERYISDKAQLQVNVPSAVAREITAVLQRDGDGAAGIAASMRSNVAARPATASAAGAGGSVSTSNSDRPVVELTASSPLLFIVAQREIFLLIAADSLKPFLDSQPYRNYKQACQAKVTW